MFNRLQSLKKNQNLIKICFDKKNNNRSSNIIRCFCSIRPTSRGGDIFSTKSSNDAIKGTIRSNEDIEEEIEMFSKKTIKKKKVETDPASLTLAYDIQEAMEKAYNEFQKGNHEEALKRYYWILSKTPYDNAVRLQRATVLENISRLSDAIADCNTIINTATDGEVLSEAFVIKGVCLLRQEKYNESIVAFEKSLVLIPNPKVVDLKKEAESMLYPDTVVVPSHEDDYEFFNGLSSTLMDCAIVKKSSIHGRGIFATRDINEEELIFEVPSLLSISTELATNKFDRHDHDHCNHCHISLKPLELENENEISKSKEFPRIEDTLNRMTNLPLGDISGIGCPQCNQAVFCSNECESQGLAKHKLICTGTPSNIHNPFLTKFYHEISKLEAEERTIYLLMLQIFSLQYTTGGNQDEPLRPMQLDEFMKRLVYSEPSKHQSTYLSRRDSKIHQLMKGIFSNREISKEIYYRVKSIIQLNSVAFPTSRIKILSEKNPMDELGYSFDFQEIPSQQLFSILVQGSFFNHSCEPNVFVATPVVNDKSIRFCSRRPIKKGEELFISYLEGQNLPFDTRKFSLQSSHSFICNCQACISKKTVDFLSLLD
ncbi:hypothetical protein ACTA71_003443 [Dictyostelium dimigraforme]